VIHGADCAVLTVADHDRARTAKPFQIATCSVREFSDVARESLHVAGGSRRRSARI
jgi:hypothetical protein